jgi:hypothetical protein
MGIKKTNLFVICLLALSSMTCISLSKIVGFSTGDIDKENSNNSCDPAGKSGNCIDPATEKPTVVPTKALPARSTPAKPEPTTAPEPTTNPNTPLQLPAEMSGSDETSKPSLILSNTYSDPDNLFTVSYPEGWQLSRTGKWQEICMDGDKFVCFQAQISDYPKDGLLSTFLDDTYEIFKATVSDYELLNREEILLNGYPAVMFENDYHFKNSYNQGYAVYLLNNNRHVGYQIHAEIQEMMIDYELYYETLKQMVYSFTPGE